VLLWKARLRELGYDVPPGEVFDEDTAVATAAYQQSLGLVGDGIAGPRTLRTPFRRRFRWFR
jgi:peptidoglycan hydrolase-like protein with peptidoglycan-binding domain